MVTGAPLVDRVQRTRGDAIVEAVRSEFVVHLLVGVGHHRVPVALAAGAVRIVNRSLTFSTGSMDRTSLLAPAPYRNTRAAG